MISPETRAEICRLVRSEHFTITKTAKTLNIHHSTVRYALEHDGRIPTKLRTKKSALDPFASFIQYKLNEYPNIHASTLWRMLKDRGYQGCQQMVRLRLQALRGSRLKRAYMPITVFAGEEAQVDWAHFGSIKVGKGQRKLSCFLMVLSHSRALFAKFFFDQTLDSFLAGHIQAFQYFGGVPRQLRYDNLKSAVAERYGQSVRFNPQLLELAAYYAFKPSACNPYSGHEKGRVERAVRYLRESFFVGRGYATIDKLNAGLDEWLSNVAAKRPWPDDRQKTVIEVWQEEKANLISLPQQPFNICVQRPVRSGKIPFIRFDKNNYSIPFQFVGQPLSLSATEQQVRISNGTEQLACHQRSYSCGEKIMIQEHFSGLNLSRPGGHTIAARSYLNELIPETGVLFTIMTERGTALGLAAAKMTELLKMYGKETLTEAIKQAVMHSYGEVSYLARICDQLSRQKNQVIALPVELPMHLPGALLDIKPHDVSSYDELTQ